MAEVCVDASFVINVALPEPKSELAREKWDVVGWSPRHYHCTVAMDV